MSNQLPTFSFNHQVTEESGKQDKIAIVLALGRLYGTQINLDEMRQTLGQGWLFNAAQQTRNARPPLTIRQRPVDGSALFRGKLCMSNYYRGQRSAETSSGLKLVLYLNPTRFARYNPRPLDLENAHAQLNFRQRRLPENARLEFGTDDNDNWIPDSLRYVHFYRPSVWQRFLRQYVEGIIETIKTEIQDAALNHDVELEEEPSPSFSLQSVETYWEFDTPDPLKTVSLCEPLLRRFSENPSRRNNYKTVTGGQVTHNCRSFLVNVRTGIDLVVYSKTNRRIRVEVRHSLTDCASIVGGQIQSTSMRHLLYKIRTARDDATSIVNSALCFMQSRNTFPEQSASVAQFLYDMVQAVGHWEGAGTLLSMSVENGKIVTDSNISEHVHSLRRAGLIRAQLQNRRRRYLIAERYEQALQELASANKNLLGPRKRKRKTS